MIITPKFLEQRTIISCLLLPFALLYFILSQFRQKFGKKFTIPQKFVLCIGNITIGGTGKTPTTIAIAKELQKKYTVCVLSRGYGRKGSGFFKIEEHHTPIKTGDEPKIISKFTNVYLYSNIKDLQKNYHKITEDIIIMDDGMQNNIAKNFILTVIGRNGIGNGFIFPAGLMRETMHKALKKTSAILYTSNARINVGNVDEYQAKIKTNCIAPKSGKYIAFSGLGDNKKFHTSLQNDGYNIVKFMEFIDHYFYTEKDLQKIHTIAEKMDCQILTTAKDFIKIPQKWQKNMFVFEIEYELPNEVIAKIDEKIQAFL